MIERKFLLPWFDFLMEKQIELLKIIKIKGKMADKLKIIKVKGKTTDKPEITKVKGGSAGLNLKI